MVVVADENIPFVKECLGPWAEVRVLAGRRITAEAVRGADALLVRSVTRVGRELLEGSRVRFVGTATSGVDHVDVEWLRERGIGFADAAGSNSRSVAEWFHAVLFRWLVERGRSLAGLSVGVVGCGRIGSMVADALERLGVRVARYDPPLEERGGGGRWSSWDDVLACDVVTAHVPLVAGGRHPTWHLFGEEFFRSFRGGLFVNASRGPVCDNRALRRALDSGGFDAVLDVWEGEPVPDAELIRRVFLGTPHVAGYSFDGKLAGTLMVRDALLRHFGLDPAGAPCPCLEAPVTRLEVPAGGGRLEEVVDGVLRQVYDPRRDDERLRVLADLPGPERGREFDRLRKEYPVRRELAAHVWPDGLAGEVRRVLDILSGKA